MEVLLLQSQRVKVNTRRNGIRRPKREHHISNLGTVISDALDIRYEYLH